MTEENVPEEDIPESGREGYLPYSAYDRDNFDYDYVIGGISLSRDSAIYGLKQRLSKEKVEIVESFIDQHESSPDLENLTNSDDIKFILGVYRRFGELIETVESMSQESNSLRERELAVIAIRQGEDILRTLRSEDVHLAVLAMMIRGVTRRYGQLDPNQCGRD